MPEAADITHPYKYYKIHSQYESHLLYSKSADLNKTHLDKYNPKQ
jgi:hypothetical protein